MRFQSWIIQSLEYLFIFTFRVVEHAMDSSMSQIDLFFNLWDEAK